nr:LysM peptidoglycan-binding domain-containing protein [Solidesulfovibrio sp.]
MPRLSRLLLTFISLSLIATACPDSARAYTVQAGDTPLSIAKKHNISVDDLLKANKGLKPSKMKVGETLAIPGGSPAKAEKSKDTKKEKSDRKSEAPSPKERAAEARDRKQEKETKSQPSKSGGHYTVKKGDTLGAIAGKHGISVDDLLKANKGLNASRLGVGQEIALPGSVAPAKAAEPESGTTTYTAHRKDTVNSVARKFHISAKELARLNPDMGKKLHSGQKLTVPLVKSKAEPVEEATEHPVPATPSRPAPVAEEPVTAPARP